MPSTVKGPGILIAQFAGDEPPFNTWPAICRWAADLGYKGIQLPAGDPRFFHLQTAAESKTYCDEIIGVGREHGISITELSIPALEPAHAIARVMGLAPATAETPSDGDQPVRPRRQGRTAGRRYPEGQEEVSGERHAPLHLSPSGRGGLRSNSLASALVCDERSFRAVALNFSIPLTRLLRSRPLPPGRGIAQSAPHHDHPHRCAFRRAETAGPVGLCHLPDGRRSRSRNLARHHQGAAASRRGHDRDRHAFHRPDGRRSVEFRPPACAP